VSHRRRSTHADDDALGRSHNYDGGTKHALVVWSPTSAAQPAQVRHRRRSRRG
jgi:hypothetical protein